MFSPFAAEWDLDEHQLRAALACAEVDGVDANILSEENPGTRKLMFHDLLHGTSDTLVALLNRLKAIVESFFESFIESHLEWSARINVFVARRDHPSLRGKEHALVERFQKGGGLCCMHAPVALQHYLVAMSNTDKTPLNIAEKENECNELS
ncbi:hypothetical protein HDU77_004568 [Chytriomyces hyalinus]|nr:hypothetical protein HDU77_004568 [Chytriomyces hyalinus]